MRRRDGELTLEVSGDLDWGAVLRLEPQWEVAVEEAGLDDVTIDLTRVGFVDSTGIGLLTKSFERIRARGARLRIVKPQEHVFRVFEVVGLDELLPFVEAP